MEFVSSHLSTKKKSKLYSFFSPQGILSRYPTFLSGKIGCGQVFFAVVIVDEINTGWNIVGSTLNTFDMTTE